MVDGVRGFRGWESLECYGKFVLVLFLYLKEKYKRKKIEKLYFFKLEFREES